MQTYSLPIDLEQVDLNSEFKIDMSDLNFDVDSQDQKHAAFVFFRNSGLNQELDFSNCSYEDKDEYLMLFMQTNLDIHAPILASTWMEILSAKDGGGIYLPTILSADEIKQFREDHKLFLDEMYCIINSLPVYAMYTSDMNGKLFNVDEIPSSDFDGIKLANFSKLVDFDSFILLIDGSTPSKFYRKLFLPKEFYINQIMSKLPYGNMLQMMFAAPEIQDEAIDAINDLLIPPGTARKEESDYVESENSDS